MDKTYKPKNYYARKLFTYVLRRRACRAKYSSKEYTIKSKKLRRRIDQLRAQIKIIERREQFVKTLFTLTKLYFSESPKKDANSPIGYNCISRDMFYRYGLEHGVGGGILNKFLGFKNKSTPMFARRRALAQDRDKTYKSFCRYLRFKNGNKEFTLRRSENEGSKKENRKADI